MYASFPLPLNKYCQFILCPLTVVHVDNQFILCPLTVVHVDNQFILCPLTVVHVDNQTWMTFKSVLIAIYTLDSQQITNRNFFCVG